MAKTKSPHTGLPEGKPALSISLVDGARAMMEKALGDGAVAIMVVYENSNGECKCLFQPRLDCVRQGLLNWISNIAPEE